MEATIARLNAAGYRVHNLYQTEDGWRCNLVDAHKAYEFDEGKTAREALENAERKATAEQEDPFA